jgi:hypothetical protein
MIFILLNKKVPRGVLEEVLARELIVAPNDTSYEESKFKSEEEPTKAHEAKPQEGNKKEEESKEQNDSKQKHVEELNK